MSEQQKKRRRGYSIGFYAVSLILITALPLILASAVNVISQINRDEDVAREQLRVLADDAIGDVSRWINDKKTLLSAIAARPSTKALKCEPFVEDYINFSAELSALILVNRAGEVMCQYSKVQFAMPAPQAMLSRQIVKDVMKTNDFVLGTVEQGLTRKVWLVVAGRPVKGDDDTVVGYLFLTTDLVKASQRIFEGKSRSPTITVVDDSGSRAMRWPDPESTVGKQMTLQTRIVPPEVINDDRVRKSVKPLLADGGNVPGTRWQVAVSLPRSEATSVTERSAYMLFLFLGLATSLTILATYFGTKLISRPIQAISRMAGSINSAQQMPDFSASVVPREIVETANALIRMSRDAVASEARYRAIIDALPIPSALNDNQGNIVFLNRAFTERIGYTLEEIPTLTDWWPKGYPDPSYRQWLINEWMQRLSRAQESGQPFKSLEIEVTAKNGTKVMVIGDAVPLEGFHDGLNLVTLVDITERARIEQKLVRSEKLNREIVNASPVPMRVSDNNGNTLYVNDALRETFGYSLSDIPTTASWRSKAYPDPDYAKVVDEKWKAANDQSSTAQQPFAPVQINIRTNDNRSLPVLALSRSLLSAEGSVRISMYFDISERVILERRLEAANQFALSIIDALSKEICVIDGAGRIIEVNKAWRDYAAESIPASYDWIGQNYLTICDQAIASGDVGAIEAKTLIQDVLSGRVNRGELEYLCQVQGEAQYFLMTVTKFNDGIKSGAVIGHRNITELRSSQQKLAQSDKLSAVGQLTGGVAHDINNALAIIIGNTELIADSAGPGSFAARLSARVLNAANGAAGLIGRLLAFSRKSPIEPEDLELSSVVSDVMKTLGRTLGGRITLNFTPPADAVWLHLDRAMLQSCLINLSVNARDAMPNGGELTFAVGRGKGKPGKEDQEWAFVSVKDTGIGMTDEVRKKVFEPFFTTKPAGKGTGLGLAMVYGFVKQCAGEIDVESAPGVGTKFNMYFPRIDVTKAGSEEANQMNFKLRENYVVLVVDDNEELRETICIQLESFGAQVLQASSVEAARHLIDQRSDIAFILSDLALGPGETGIELAEWIRDRGLKIPGAILSGYIDIDPERVTRLGWKWLQKPAHLKDIFALLVNN